MKKGVTLSLFYIQLFYVACSPEKENIKIETVNQVHLSNTNLNTSSTNEQPVSNKEVEQKTAISTPATLVALDFVNAYALHCDNANKARNTKKWVEINQLITPNFKKKYKNLVEEAYKDDPELGLDSDPIFDAQDYPDDGFVLLKNDENGFITLQGKDWPEFQLVVKVVQVNNNWFVDGAGVINVPEEKRVKRF